MEWAPAGIRVNALCPGWTATDLNEALRTAPDGGQSVIASGVDGTLGSPRRWLPAAFLASDASSFMTGQVLVVDGGQLAAG